ncbi:SREBP regulating gene protein isoform X2 [Tachyglossus aculeatus]|uniref:SREBP regulating gene protein isoform X2 n=1 Tax=Tachyglossus aculeatus TaxID=9261 RepID=UPI0018F48180|nr:SREBP regulating gene protein isoform X2 [Tachyglossus aculeatus]
MVPASGRRWACRRLVRRRWVLAVVFALSLVYFLSSTFRQEERTGRDRSLLQMPDPGLPIPWKLQFSLGNSSRRAGGRCRNSVQGKRLITDELGHVCERKHLLRNGCCDVEASSTRLFSCEGCLSHGCCAVYEHCVSCCLQPGKSVQHENTYRDPVAKFCYGEQPPQLLLS